MRQYVQCRLCIYGRYRLQIKSETDPPQPPSRNQYAVNFNHPLDHLQTPFHIIRVSSGVWSAFVFHHDMSICITTVFPAPFLHISTPNAEMCQAEIALRP